MLLLPVSEAQAFYASTGSGQVTGIQASSSAASVVTIAVDPTTPFAYADSSGATATSLSPGGNVARHHLDTNLARPQQIHFVLNSE